MWLVLCLSSVDGRVASTSEEEKRIKADEHRGGCIAWEGFEEMKCISMKGYCPFEADCLGFRPLQHA